MPCVFCEIVERRSPASVIHEDAICLAFMTIEPINVGHALIIPKRHVVTLDDCDDATAKHLIAVLRQLNRAVQDAVGCDGVLNEIMNGEAAGQEVFHLHVHVIPRNRSDGFGWRYPAGYGSQPRRQALDETAQKIAAQLVA